jgi:hypothetical protein
VKDAVGTGTMTAAPNEREVGSSSQRDRPDRLLDTIRCYIRFRQRPGVLKGAGAVTAELSTYCVWKP